MPSTAVDTLPPDDPLLRARPFTAPTPTRRIGLVWRASYPRHQAIDLLRQVLLDCQLPGCQPVK
jgi:LysR family hydrogen peroxide-inducible transcriptional activator